MVSFTYLGLRTRALSRVCQSAV